MVIPGYYACSPAESEVQQRKTKYQQERGIRIKVLKREIQVAKQRLREYDHLLAELRSLEKEELDELKESLRRRG